MKNYEIEDYKLYFNTQQIIVSYSVFKEETNEDLEAETAFSFDTLLAWLLAEDYIDNHFIGPDGLMVTFTTPGEDRDTSSTLHISEFLNRNILDEFLIDNI
jgi:hypothetical protein